MFSYYAKVALIAAVCVFLIRCNNYSLVEKLQNPGGSTSVGATGTGSCGANCRIYITTAIFNGNLGGAGGADISCISNPNNPAGAGKGNWRAMIAGGGRVACTTTNCTTGGATENLNWALKANTNYRRATDDFPIGTTNASGIFTFPLSNSFAIGVIDVWTGLTTDWLVNGNTCLNWTDNTTGQGMAGQTGGTTFSNIAFGGQTCPGSFPIFCAEQ